MIARSPQLRLKYDDRAKEEKDRFSFIKDAHAQGRSEGLAEGEARGELIGKIQTFERILGLAVSEKGELFAMEAEALSRLANSLEQRFQNRSC